MCVCVCVCLCWNEGSERRLALMEIFCQKEIGKSRNETIDDDPLSMMILSR